MGNAQDNDEKRIMKAVDKSVRFKYPQGDRKGTLRDRVVVPSPSTTGVSYWDVVDLIEFPDEQESLWIRIGYYHKSGDKLVFSRSPLTDPVSSWKNLFLQAAKDMPQFRNLLEEVMAVLQEGDPEQP